MNGSAATSNSYLGTEKISKLIIKLALPTVTAQIVNMLYNLVDRIYIGNIEVIGEKALTGLGVCQPIILFIAAFSALICYGGAPKSAIAMGEGNYKKAEKILSGCFTAQIVVSLILTVVFSIWHREFLMLFGASLDTIDYACEYIKIYVLGTVFVEIALGMSAFITAQGFASVSMKTVLIGAVCNIILDPIFIFLFDMGVKGAALATVISQGVSTVWVLVFMFGKKPVLRMRKENIVPDFGLLFSCIALGLSPFIMQATESVLSACFNSSLQEYGGDIAVGSMTILSSVNMFLMLPLQGLVQGAQPVVSYNFGAGNAGRVKNAFFVLLKISVVYSFVMWASVMLFPGFFARLFGDNPALIEYTKGSARIFFAVSVLMGVQIACQQTFVAIGNAKSSLFLAVLRKLILLIPLIYILPVFFADKTFAVFLAEPVADFIAVCTTSLMFFVQFRKTLKNMDSHSHVENGVK